MDKTAFDIAIQSHNDYQKSYQPSLTSNLNRDWTQANYQYQIIMKSIKAFELELDEDHEIAIQLAAFGQSITMHVTKIDYSDPCLIHFYGYVKGNYSELIQHVTQLSFLLMAVPKVESDRPARRIGFLNDPK